MQHRRPAGRVYRSVEAPELTPDTIRRTEFPYTRVGRRGLDPEAVYAMVYRLADEMARLVTQVRSEIAENERLKANLRAWHSQHSQGRDDPRRANQRSYPEGSER
ncbi:cell division protein DivIVA [Micromonospora sp. NBC_01796]|uniref:cell division protein DivIVA n=1 Tax=Micromonospora sp. NBC_01796 TaxID=2975987 RepID=UPI002DD89549|nr:cell division protein DivIVA [Micromonospora sp. NBC_01796]WSA88020.1 cell division protein DivIVA [Micromonospora sp. NBC_01796]